MPSLEAKAPMVDITRDKGDTARVLRGLRTLGATKTGRRSEQRGGRETCSWCE